MITFLGGPADKQALLLHRAPYLLRVVTDGQKWDALDQPEDSPATNETIHVYRRKGEASVVHLNRGRKGSGFYAMATYEYIRPAFQPSEAILRDNQQWLEWVKDWQFHKL